MGKYFLGKPWHWLLLALVFVPLIVLGEWHVHISQFNTYVVLLIALVALMLALIVVPHKPGEQITRDPLEEE